MTHKITLDCGMLVQNIHTNDFYHVMSMDIFDNGNIVFTLGHNYNLSRWSEYLLVENFTLLGDWYYDYTKGISL